MTLGTTHAWRQLNEIFTQKTTGWGEKEEGEIEREDRRGRRKGIVTVSGGKGFMGEGERGVIRFRGMELNSGVLLCH